MSHEPPAERIHVTLAVRVQRERRAQTALQRGLAEHAAATEQSEQMARAVSLQTSARLARERQIYEGMLGRSFSPREIAGVRAELLQLDRAAAALAAELSESVRIAEAAREKVEQLRRHFRGVHRARRKWDELLLLAERRQIARQTLLEELTLSDDRLARLP